MKTLTLTEEQIKLIQTALAVVAPMAMSSNEYDAMAAIEAQTGITRDAEAMPEMVRNTILGWAEGCDTHVNVAAAQLVGLMAI